MAKNNGLELAIIGAALIASRAVDIHDYDRELLNRIMQAGVDEDRLLQLPVLRQLRTLAQAIHTCICAPGGANAAVPEPLVNAGRQCNHSSCGCTVAAGEPSWPFCSQHCKEAGDTVELRCDCQHLVCRRAGNVAQSGGA